MEYLPPEIIIKILEFIPDLLDVYCFLVSNKKTYEWLKDSYVCQRIKLLDRCTQVCLRVDDTCITVYSIPKVLSLEKDRCRECGLTQSVPKYVFTENMVNNTGFKTIVPSLRAHCIAEASIKRERAMNYALFAFRGMTMNTLNEKQYTKLQWLFSNPNKLRELLNNYNIDS